MGLTQFSLGNSVQWHQVGSSTTGYAPQKQNDSLSFALAALDITVWNEVYVATLSIPAAGSVTLDLTSGLFNLVSVPLVFTKVKSLIVQPIGAAIKIGPGASNGLQWFWDDATAYSTVKDGGVHIHSDSAADASTTVDATHKTLTIANLTSAATAWSSVTAYIVGNIVSKSGNNYIAILAGTNHDPIAAPTFWLLTNVCSCELNILGST